MKIICAPKSFDFNQFQKSDLNIILYGYRDNEDYGDIGYSLLRQIIKSKLKPSNEVWDLLTIALSALSADLACHRNKSPDGWTREIELIIAVSNPDFWNTHKGLVERQLRFLTTDIWNISFIDGGLVPEIDEPKLFPDDCSVALLSGGLDSFIGLIDLVAEEKKPYLVSQVVRGDAEKQRYFTQLFGRDLNHLQLNHSARIPNNEAVLTQRARSIVFLAYGVLAATCLKDYKEGKRITLYMAENGFISINPPLTGARIGSLSTRTSHPVFINLFQEMLVKANLNIEIQNPYKYCTKGEMLTNCKTQEILQQHAHSTTSCGRYHRYGYVQCGRCVPCLIRRASFKKWGVEDLTDYKFKELSIDNSDHARFDDVRSVAMAVVRANSGPNGFDEWLGNTLNTFLLGNTDSYKDMIIRGLDELEILLKDYGVL